MVYLAPVAEYAIALITFVADHGGFLHTAAMLLTAHNCIVPPTMLVVNAEIGYRAESCQPLQMPSTATSRPMITPCCNANDGAGGHSHDGKASKTPADGNIGEGRIDASQFQLFNTNNSKSSPAYWWNTSAKSTSKMVWALQLAYVSRKQRCSALQGGALRLWKTYNGRKGSHWSGGRQG